MNKFERKSLQKKERSDKMNTKGPRPQLVDLAGTISSEEMVHYRSGAKRVEKGIPPTHLVCPQADIRTALICAEGVERHALIVDEAEFTTGDKGLPKFNLIKHIQNHWNKWRAGDRTEDHLAKIQWGIQKYMHKESQDPKLIADETQPWITACTHAKDMVSDEFRDELE